MEIIFDIKMMMITKSRKLGNVLSVSEIGSGCMGLSHAYGYALDKNLAIRRIHEAFDCGYTFFDTAEVYTGKHTDGTDAINEEIVGDALRPLRDKVIIASKGGISLDANHKIVLKANPQAFRQSLEQSLRRLGVHVIDLYYQHRMDPAVEPEVVASAMQEFIKEGKIRFWGISNGSEDYIRRAHAVCPVTCVQLRYSMMARWNEKYFPMLEELKIGFVAFSQLANGFLTSAAGEDRQKAWQKRGTGYIALACAKKYRCNSKKHSQRKNDGKLSDL